MRNLDVVSEDESRAPWQLAAVYLSGEAGSDVESPRRRDDEVDAPDVAALAQIELRRERDIGAERGLPALNRLLRRVVEDQRPAAAGVGRHRVDAVELRDLLPAAGQRQLAGPAVVGEVLLIAVADVVRARVKRVGAVRRRERVAEAGEEQTAAQVLVALEARRIAVDTGRTAADEQLP